MASDPSSELDVGNRRSWTSTPLIVIFFINFLTGLFDLMPVLTVHRYRLRDYGDQETLRYRSQTCKRYCQMPTGASLRTSPSSRSSAHRVAGTGTCMNARLLSTSSGEVIPGIT